MPDPAASPVLIVLAGPNGAGKSTFHRAFLADTGLPFVNADYLAGATNLDPYEAARAADAVRRLKLDRGESFIMETVFSDPVGAKLEFLRTAVDLGYDARLLYIGLQSQALAQARVAARVWSGGHDVPDEKIAARYLRSLDNLAKAIGVVPWVRVYDNSDAKEPYRLIMEFDRGSPRFQARGRLPRWFRTVLKKRLTEGL